MRFALHYGGPLRPAGNPAHKFALRRRFHAQLAQLWCQEPLSGMKALQLPLDAKDRKVWNDVTSLRPRGAFNFVPLATGELRLTGALELVVFRPEPPGRLFTDGGDMDNRLKTLFDALSIPKADAIPAGEKPGADEDPFFCVFEDDNLITSVAVQTEQLLGAQAVNDRFHVELFIRVHVTPTAPNMLTLGLG